MTINQGTNTPTTTPVQGTTTDRINQALHVLQLALSESGRSNYNRWQVKDAIDRLTAGDVPAAKSNRPQCCLSKLQPWQL